MPRIERSWKINEKEEKRRENARAEGVSRCNEFRAVSSLPPILSRNK